MEERTGSTTTTARLSGVRCAPIERVPILPKLLHDDGTAGNGTGGLELWAYDTAAADGTAANAVDAAVKLAPTAESEALDIRMLPESLGAPKNGSYDKENFRIGLLLASKGAAQFITSPFIGPLVDRIGHSIPMFCGFLIMFVSTLVYAFGENYWVLFSARAVQGIGSSCSSVAGMGLLAVVYPEDKERGSAMAIAMGGLALGALIGPSFGGFMYQFVSKASPFLVLASVALLDGLLQLVVLQPKLRKKAASADGVGGEDSPLAATSSIKDLIFDPYIIIVAVTLVLANMCPAIIESTLPLHMLGTMDAEEWQLGTMLLPCAFAYLVGTNVFGWLGHKIGRWLAALIGLLIMAISYTAFPFIVSIPVLIAPLAGAGFGMGMVDSSLMPELGRIVDLRHNGIYGSVYAIADVAFCIAFTIGPLLSGGLVNAFGFEISMIVVAVIFLVFSPVLLFLKNVKPKGGGETATTKF